MLTAVEVAQLELDPVDLELDEALAAEAVAVPVSVPVKAAVVLKDTPYNPIVSHSIR
jgi:hypothetical protein